MSFEKPDASVIAEHALETPRRKERPPFSPELVRSSQAYELLYEAEHGFLPGDDPVVQEVVQLLTDYPGEDKPVRLRVSLDSESPNAFVLPSGTIVINRALLGMLDVQEMKVVIAHEIRHFRSRDAEEFTQAVEDIQASNKKVKKSVALLGRMRFAESRADIHGLIDGDEGGTHPAALRTLMQKLEKWKRDNVPDAATGKVHGSEIDRIVNAGMAAQVYDFSTDYSVRTPFSERVEAFCAAEIPPRWPESGECEPEEAEAAFKDASPMEILSCLRRWRIDDRMAAAEIFDEEYIRLKKKIDEGGKNLKTDQKKLKELEEQGVEVQIVGDGYEVAVRHLEAKVAEKARTATELQRKALVHFLLESTAGISSHELLDSPIEGVRSYLDDIEDRAALQEVLAVISPDRIRELGAVCMGGAGVAQFTGNVFRSANEAGVFKTDGVFDVAGYLEEMMASVRATAHVLEEVSLQGKRGYQLPDAAIDELLVNIDVHESAKPAFDALLEFQRVMSEAGLPSRSGKLLAALRRQHFYKDVEHEEIYAHEGPDKLYGTHIDRFVVRLYEGAHPLCRQMPVGHYAALAGCPVFADNPKDYDDFSVEGKEKTASDVAKVLFGKGREEIAFLLTILVKKPGRDEFREAIGLERGGEPAYALAVCERLQFSRLLTSLDRFKEFCAALNAMDEDAASENGEKESYFVSVAALSIAHLMSQVGTIDWLPKEKDKALLTLVEAMADTPGRAVSQLIGDLHCLEGMTGLVDTQDVWRVGLQMAKLVLNHDGRTARDPEVHVRQADPKANRLDLGDELVPILRFLKRTAEESLRHKEFTQEDTIRLVEELHEVIFRLRKVVPLAPRKDSEVLDTDEEFALYLLEKVQDLERPISRRLCLYAASHIHDVMLRARLVRHVVAREFATGTMSVSDKIDLLWKNPHVRPVPLGTLRDRVIDEEVQSPEQLTQLREIVLEQVDQVFSGDRMGAYAVLESLERRKDAMTLFRLAFEYSEFDEDAKRDIFLTIRQDWSELGISSTDEVALIRTEAILQSLEVAEPLLKHALMRKLLIGERGLLHTPKRRRELFAYLLDSVVDVTDSSAELLEVTREMLDVVAEVGETDVLFMALSPFLEERVFLPAKKKADWIPILRDIYNSGQKARQTLAAVNELRESIFDEDDPDARKNFPMDQRIQAHIKTLGVNLESEATAQERPTLEKMVVRVAESIGADGVRFLQVLDQYVENLSPELEKAFQDANDNVRGQPKLTARETLTRFAPNLRVVRMGKRLGGGSLMSPYDADVADPTVEGGVAREALKVLAPNVEFISDTVEVNLFKVIDGLIAKNPDRYRPARQALEDISRWIRGDIRDERFFDVDPDFRMAHSGFRVPGMRYGLYIPVSRPVDGDPKAPSNRRVKREELVNGMTVNRAFTDPQGHDLRDATSLIAKAFAQQLVRGVMHSDVHPGNYMLCTKGGKDWVAMIDRAYYLELNANDQKLVLGLTQEGVTTDERVSAIREYVKTETSTDLPDELCTSVRTLLNEQGERGIRAVMARLRGAGVPVPFKLTLLLKNVGSMNRMARRVGFDSFRDALGYLPEPA